MIVPKVFKTIRCDVCPHFKRPFTRTKEVNALRLEEIPRPEDSGEPIFAPSNEIKVRLAMGRKSSR